MFKINDEVRIIEAPDEASDFIGCTGTIVSIDEYDPDYLGCMIQLHDHFNSHYYAANQDEIELIEGGN